MLFNYNHDKPALMDALGLPDDEIRKLADAIRRSGDIMILKKFDNRSRMIEELSMVIGGLTVDEIAFVFAMLFDMMILSRSMK